VAVIASKDSVDTSSPVASVTTRPLGPTSGSDFVEQPSKLDEARTPVFDIEIVLAPPVDSSSLLTMASVFHRRGVSVVSAQMCAGSNQGQVFRATFHAAPRQASTLLKTVQAIVDVLHAEMHSSET